MSSPLPTPTPATHPPTLITYAPPPPPNPKPHQTAVANRGEPFLSAIDDTTPGALDALAATFGFRCVYSADAKRLAARFYGGAVPWFDFPATVTTCFSYAMFEKGEGAAAVMSG